MTYYCETESKAYTFEAVNDIEARRKALGLPGLLICYRPNEDTRGGRPFVVVVEANGWPAGVQPPSTHLAPKLAPVPVLGQ